MSEEKKIGDKLLKASQEKLDTIARQAAAMMNGITTVADTRGISKDELEAVYKVGLGFYRTGKYEDAEKIFYFLCTIEHVNSKYWTALGAVRQVRKNYQEALTAYAAAAMFDIRKPKPHFYAAQCALAMGDLDSAESGCRTVLELCPADVAGNAEFRQKAEQLMNTIKSVREAKK